MGCHSIAFAGTALLFSVMSAHADDGAIISRWYSALLVADRTELSDLLDDGARIRARRSRRRTKQAGVHRLDGRMAERRRGHDPTSDRKIEAASPR
jgi:hypothetical protein